MHIYLQMLKTSTRQFIWQKEHRFHIRPLHLFMAVLDFLPEEIGNHLLDDF